MAPKHSQILKPHLFPHLHSHHHTYSSSHSPSSPFPTTTTDPLNSTEMLSSGESMFPYHPRPVPMIDRSWKPKVELAPNCPRCDSSNTKFCYYNNYSLSQPRYFCKGCRRYWTKGGSLRNVPVGGGCRKNRRGRSLRQTADHGVTGGDPSSCGRGGLLSDQLVRPDVMLDDPMGNSPGMSGGSGSVSSADTPRSSGGSDIDLAALYSKFLNPCPEFDHGHVMPELQVELDDPIDFAATNIQLQQGIIDHAMDCHQMPPYPITDGQFELVDDDQLLRVASIDDDFHMSTASELLLDDEVIMPNHDLFWSDFPIVPSSVWNPPQNTGFSPFFEDSTTASQHQNPLCSAWTTTLDPPPAHDNLSRTQ